MDKFNDYVSAEYLLENTPDKLRSLYGDARVKTAGLKTGCKLEVTKRVLKRLVSPGNYTRLSILRVTGPDDQSIAQFNRLVEACVPLHSSRREYPKRASLTLLSKPENSLSPKTKNLSPSRRSAPSHTSYPSTTLLNDRFQSAQAPSDHVRPVSPAGSNTPQSLTESFALSRKTASRSEHTPKPKPRGIYRSPNESGLLSSPPRDMVSPRKRSISPNRLKPDSGGGGGGGLSRHVSENHRNRDTSVSERTTVNDATSVSTDPALGAGTQRRFNIRNPMGPGTAMNTKRLHLSKSKIHEVERRQTQEQGNESPKKPRRPRSLGARSRLLSSSDFSPLVKREASHHSRSPSKRESPQGIPTIRAKPRKPKKTRKSTSPHDTLSPDAHEWSRIKPAKRTPSISPSRHHEKTKHDSLAEHSAVAPAEKPSPIIVEPVEEVKSTNEAVLEEMARNNEIETLNQRETARAVPARGADSSDKKLDSSVEQKPTSSVVDVTKSPHAPIAPTSIGETEIIDSSVTPISSVVQNKDLDPLVESALNLQRVAERQKHQTNSVADVLQVDRSSICTTTVNETCAPSGPSSGAVASSQAKQATSEAKKKKEEVITPGQHSPQVRSVTGSKKAKLDREDHSVALNTEQTADLIDFEKSLSLAKRPVRHDVRGRVKYPFKVALMYAKDEVTDYSPGDVAFLKIPAYANNLKPNPIVSIHHLVEHVISALSEESMPSPMTSYQMNYSNAEVDVVKREDLTVVPVTKSSSRSLDPRQGNRSSKDFSSLSSSVKANTNETTEESITRSPEPGCETEDRQEVLPTPPPVHHCEDEREDEAHLPPPPAEDSADEDTVTLPIEGETSDGMSPKPFVVNCERKVCDSPRRSAKGCRSSSIEEWKKISPPKKSDPLAVCDCGKVEAASGGKQTPMIQVSDDKTCTTLVQGRSEDANQQSSRKSAPRPSRKSVSPGAEGAHTKGSRPPSQGRSSRSLAEELDAPRSSAKGSRPPSESSRVCRPEELRPSSQFSCRSRSPKKENKPQSQFQCPKAGETEMKTQTTLNSPSCSLTGNQELESQKRDSQSPRTCEPEVGKPCNSSTSVQPVCSPKTEAINGQASLEESEPCQPEVKERNSLRAPVCSSILSVESKSRDSGLPSEFCEPESKEHCSPQAPEQPLCSSAEVKSRESKSLSESQTSTVCESAAESKPQEKVVCEPENSSTDTQSHENELVCEPEAKEVCGLKSPIQPACDETHSTETKSHESKPSSQYLEEEKCGLKVSNPLDGSSTTSSMGSRPSFHNYSPQPCQIKAKIPDQSPCVQVDGKCTLATCEPTSNGPINCILQGVSSLTDKKSDGSVGNPPIASLSITVNSPPSKSSNQLVIQTELGPAYSQQSSQPSINAGEGEIARLKLPSQHSPDRKVSGGSGSPVHFNVSIDISSRSPPPQRQGNNSIVEPSSSSSMQNCNASTVVSIDLEDVGSTQENSHNAATEASVKGRLESPASFTLVTELHEDGGGSSTLESLYRVAAPLSADETPDVGGRGVVCLSSFDDTLPEPNFNLSDSSNTYVSSLKDILVAGSTNAVLRSMHGTEDVETAAIHIALGLDVGVDVLGVHDSDTKAFLRYTVSLLGYGFHGDILDPSERLRWLGPSRYDLAGAIQWLKLSSYPCQITYLPSTSSTPLDESRCGADCPVCMKMDCDEEGPSGSKAIEEPPSLHHRRDASSHPWDAETVGVVDRLSADDESVTASTSVMLGERFGERELPGGWRVVSGDFVAVNAFLISCRCAKSPQGPAPSAHLGDGFCDLVLVRRCSRWQYLRFLTYLTQKRKRHDDGAVGQGAPHLRLPFVVAHRVRAFRFQALDKRGAPVPTDETVAHKTSVWCVDGEVLRNPNIICSVNRQLIRMYGRGPED